MIIDKLKKRNKIKDEKGNADIPIGKWIKCDKCNEILYKETIHDNFSVCTNCGNHFRLSARRRIKQIIDENTFKPFEINLKTINPLSIDGYLEKIETLKVKTGIDEAVVSGTRKDKWKRCCYLCYGWEFFNGIYGKCCW